VFKARGKLAGTTIGLDDDLTHLQQQRKTTAWPAFKDFKSREIRTQWRAEKLLVMEGEHFVEHKSAQPLGSKGSCVLLNIRGGIDKQAESLAHLSCCDFICQTETWLTEHDKPDIFPLHTYHSICSPVRDGSGCHSGGLAVFVSHRVSKHVHFVKQLMMPATSG